MCVLFVTSGLDIFFATSRPSRNTTSGGKLSPLRNFEKKSCTGTKAILLSFTISISSPMSEEMKRREGMSKRETQNEDRSRKAETRRRVANCKTYDATDHRMDVRTSKQGMVDARAILAKAPNMMYLLIPLRASFLFRFRESSSDLYVVACNTVHYKFSASLII